MSSRGLAVFASAPRHPWPRAIPSPALSLADVGGCLAGRRGLEQAGIGPDGNGLLVTL